MATKPFVPFGKPKFGDEELLAIKRILESGWVGFGRESEAFEEELASFLGARNVLLVNSCTAALFLSLYAQGVGPGDEVICPSLTWCSTVNVVLYLGARPVYCDIDIETMSLDLVRAASLVNSRTKAIIPVHFGGRALELEPLREMLTPKVKIIEDCAHALGARYEDGLAVGASENLSCFSFYANKNLSTGDGGAIAISDDKLFEKISRLRNNGLDRNAWYRYTEKGSSYNGPDISEIGFKLGYNDILAAVGRVQLKRLATAAQKRGNIANLYTNFLLEHCPGVSVQSDVCRSSHAKHLYCARLPLESLACSRDQFLSQLRGMGIGAAIHYHPIHLMGAYSKYRSSQDQLNKTELCGASTITLPIGAEVSDDDCEKTLMAFKTIYDRNLKA